MNFETTLKMLNNAPHISTKMNMPPLAIVILDNRSKVAAAICDEDVGTLRYEIALGKASAALGMGFGTRQFHTFIQSGVLPEMFASCINGAAQGNFIPLPGGVLIKNNKQKIIGAMGISGANSDRDEMFAVQLIESVNLLASP